VSGDADEPGGAEGDKGHGRICDGCGESERTGFSLSWSTTYDKLGRGRGAFQRSFGLHNAQGGEELGGFLLSFIHLHSVSPVVVGGEAEHPTQIRDAGSRLRSLLCRLSLP